MIPALKRKILLGEVSIKKIETFEKYSQTFLEDKIHLKSYSQIASVIEVFNDVYGSLSIDKINRGHIKTFVRHRLKVNTPKTVKNYLSSIRGVFDLAIDEEVIKDNPCLNIRLPSHVSSDIEPFTTKDVSILLSNSKGWLKAFLAISFYTGMRTGEVLGLQYSDIDLAKKVISVKRSISHGKISTPKTISSIREVPILDALIPYIRTLTSRSIWLFPKQNGMSYKHVSGFAKKEWSELLNTCDIEYRKMYATRHTFIVSMLKNSNLSILDIAQIVGHSSTQMIIRNYGKFIKGEHLEISRDIQLFTDKSTDIMA